MENKFYGFCACENPNKTGADAGNRYIGYPENNSPIMTCTDAIKNAKRCPGGMYLPTDASVCQPCHQTCTSCTKGASNSCLACDTTKGFK